MGKQDYQGQSVQVGTVASVDLPYSLEDLDRIEREASRLSDDPLVRLNLQVRRSERRALDDYTADRRIGIGEAIRELLRDSLLRWKRGGEHGRG